MPEYAIGIMARYPELGKVKTRLAETVGKERALQIYQELLKTTMQLISGLDSQCFYRAIFITPTEKLASFEKEHPAYDAVCAQKGNDLGERMMNALQFLLYQDGINKALLIGCDCPEINLDMINQACSALIENNLVLGPTPDGGYYLIGMKQVYPQLFRDIEWGGNEVFQKTMAVAAEINLRVVRLPELRDLDNATDLEHFTRLGILL